MPFILISLIINHSIIFILIIILTIIILPFILFKITNLKKLIAYSSINQIG
jgi:NADH:ubiquinone oxidoreductase subunit 2 (subunit N)